MSLWSRILNSLRGERLNHDIDEELQSHIEEAVASGRELHEVHRSFGSILRQRETSHSIRVVGWLESLLADVRFGWRQLGRNKVVSASALLSLALGIGSCVAAFRLMDALLWRPLPIAHASRLYVLSRKFIGLEGRQIDDGYWATSGFNWMREAVSEQADLVGISDADRTDIAWSSKDDIEKAHVSYVSGNMFSVFGLDPALGRLLAPADDRIAAAPAAVISWTYWNHRFGRDPNVLGRVLHLGDDTFTIVGVGPRSFTGTEKGVLTDIFLPLNKNHMAAEDQVTWHRVFLMLKPGVPASTNLEPLRQHLAAVSHAFESDCSSCFRGVPPATIRRLLDKQLLCTAAAAGISDLQKEYRRLLGVLALLVALVLLIACVNVANMMTSQAASRAQEMALRISIGAGRRRLIQLMLVQSALLALFASALGALFAAWAAPFVLGLINPPDNPVALDLPADFRVLLFAAALTLGITVALGLLPSLRASAVAPVSALRGGQVPPSSRRLARAAILVQVAFCGLVLFLSALFVASFHRLQNRPLGFATDRLLLLETVAGKGQLPIVWEQTAEALRAAPGVSSVAVAGWPLLGRIQINSDISVDGAPPSPTPAFFLNVSPGWLHTMQIPLVSGRDFLPRDTSPGAAIVNQTFLKTFFPNLEHDEDAIGRVFDRPANPFQAAAGQFKIVGVTPDVPYHDLRESARPVFYIPVNTVDAHAAASPLSFATFVVHFNAGNPLASAESLRRLVALRHNGLRVSNTITEADLLRDQTVRERLIAMLAAFFGAVALLLAGIGLYAVLNDSVIQRRREIGVRMAIGSSRANIVRLVTLDLAITVVLGALAGVALGLGAARYAAALLYQVRATDADMIALPAWALLLTAVAATLPAVLRALRTNPAEILRTD